eukprot:2779784-Rhodomonas_salina.1
MHSELERLEWANTELGNSLSTTEDQLHNLVSMLPASSGFRVYGLVWLPLRTSYPILLVPVRLPCKLSFAGSGLGCRISYVDYRGD